MTLRIGAFSPLKFLLLGFESIAQTSGYEYIPADFDWIPSSAGPSVSEIGGTPVAVFPSSSFQTRPKVGIPTTIFDAGADLEK